jgi:Na+/H+ antiporter NhaC
MVDAISLINQSLIAHPSACIENTCMPINDCVQAFHTATGPTMFIQFATFVSVVGCIIAFLILESMIRQRNKKIAQLQTQLDHLHFINDKKEEKK